MNLETRDKIAKALGYQTDNHGIRGIEIIECDEHGISHVDWFIPEENPAQLLEVIKWLPEDKLLMAIRRSNRNAGALETTIMQAAAKEVSSG